MSGNIQYCNSKGNKREMICEKCFYDFLSTFIDGSEIKPTPEKMPDLTPEYNDGYHKIFGIAGVYEDGNGVVSVLFDDRTEETAICHPEDKYDLRRGIEVCILHKIFGGTKNYNDTMNFIVKEYKKAVEKIKQEKAAKELEARREAKRKRRKELMKARYEEKCKQVNKNIDKKHYSAEHVKELISALESILASMD